MAKRTGNPKLLFGQFFKRLADDDRLLPSHLGLVMALYYEGGLLPLDSFRASRRKLMRASRIRSTSTYHKCLGELVQYGYIEYEPSWHPKEASRFRFILSGEGQQDG
ncbi:hypothetical protein PQ465_02195 [Sphingobacterium oryzagri]|uniref:Helix-turn-helix domain-containing protein n=1 Tax=Sphingobacterium oryzagri TaxID=3025669 RepID=A0ABY7WKT9_9SPHI|nr:hypothetical protein [Sphingobacterium sp. KACC 22765]WDF69204.1 hypothetical protein PQ465_02195 [Sphingobacterium sp. KACC 22765]